MMNDSIGGKLRALRKEKRMTQQEIGDALNLKRATISNYEIGRRAPHISELKRIAEYFGVSLDYFGVTATNEVIELLARAQQVFSSETISTEKKDELYKALMRLYLDIK